MARLAAVELRVEGAALGADAPPTGGAAPVAAAGAPAGGAGAGLAGLPPGGVADVGVAKAIVDGMAGAFRAARCRPGGAGSSEDDDAPAPAKAFTDAIARRVAMRPNPLDFLVLPPCARASFPGPFRSEALIYRDDFTEGPVSAEGDEARHITILGGWLTKLHNELIAFGDSDGHNNLARAHGLLLRSRVYAHQVAEL